MVITSRPFQTVADVTLQDMRDWLAACLDATPSIAASGPLTADEAGVAIDVILAELGPVPLSLRTNDVTAVIAAPGAENALVAVAFPAAPNDVALEVALDALAGSEVSRLFRNLRDEGGATCGAEVACTPLTTEVMSVAIISSVLPDAVIGVVVTLAPDLVPAHCTGAVLEELTGCDSAD